MTYCGNDHYEIEFKNVSLNFDELLVFKGLIKLFKVTRREPKQLGSPGHFNLWAHAQNLVPSISISTESQRIHCKTSQGHQATQTQEKSKGNAIRSIRCNSDGTRVSIIADHVR